jgi:hypothetical protein
MRITLALSCRRDCNPPVTVNPKKNNHWFGFLGRYSKRPLKIEDTMIFPSQAFPVFRLSRVQAGVVQKVFLNLFNGSEIGAICAAMLAR